MFRGWKTMRHMACLVGLLIGVLLVGGAYAQTEPKDMLVIANNPKPRELPTLAVWQQPNKGGKMTFVKAVFPSVPGLQSDLVCYQGGDLEFIAAKPLKGGLLQLRHRCADNPQVIVVTTVTPIKGAVEFLARLEIDPKKGGKMPEQLPGLGTCWLVCNGPGFASKPDPYPLFVKRCFIFTEKGLTFLDKTQRSKTPSRPEKDETNNPPWVQIYSAAWAKDMKVPANSFAGLSKDHFIYPIIGVVSRDHRYLAAIVTDSASSVSQAWGDSFNNGGGWVAGPNGEKIWRCGIYALKNDPKELLKQVAKDFPKALTPRENRGDTQ